MAGEGFSGTPVDGLFAATPQLEALRLLLSWAATADGKGTSFVAGAISRGERKGILIANVSKGLLRGPSQERCVCVCVELPEEALGGGETTADVVGKLMASLYGTRDASANW